MRFQSNRWTKTIYMLVSTSYHQLMIFSCCLMYRSTWLYTVKTQKKCWCSLFTTNRTSCCVTLATGRWPGRRGTRPQLTTWVCSKLVWPNCGGNSSHQKEALVQQQEKVRCLFLKTYSLLISRYNYKPVILFYPLQSLIVDSVDTSFECFFFSFRFWCCKNWWRSNRLCRFSFSGKVNPAK